ncbi:hypothetical protein ACFLTJ_03660 [Chloroflexota bacterium]
MDHLDAHYQSIRDFNKQYFDGIIGFTLRQGVTIIIAVATDYLRRRRS